MAPVKLCLAAHANIAIWAVAHLEAHGLVVDAYKLDVVVWGRVDAKFVAFNGDRVAQLKADQQFFCGWRVGQHGTSAKGPVSVLPIKADLKLAGIFVFVALKRLDDDWRFCYAANFAVKTFLLGQGDVVRVNLEHLHGGEICYYGES